MWIFPILINFIMKQSSFPIYCSLLQHFLCFCKTCARWGKSYETVWLLLFRSDAIFLPVKHKHTPTPHPPTHTHTQTHTLTHYSMSLHPQKSQTFGKETRFLFVSVFDPLTQQDQSLYSCLKWMTKLTHTFYSDGESFSFRFIFQPLPIRQIFFLVEMWFHTGTEVYAPLGTILLGCLTFTEQNRHFHVHQGDHVSLTCIVTSQLLWKSVIVQ